MLVGLALWAPTTAPAQIAETPFRRPGDERLELPEPPAPDPGAVSLLPPLPPSRYDRPGRLAARGGVRVERFDFRGNERIGDADLARALRRWTGRTLSAEDLLAARDAATAVYVSRGYVTSGAVLPDQEVRDGVIRLDIVEGRIGPIELRGVRRFRPAYLRSRLRRAAVPPVDVRRLEQELRLLQDDARIRRLGARLGATDRRGESRLSVDVEEASPYRLELFAANDRSPGVGAIRGEIRLRHANLTGWGDQLSLALGTTEGLGEYELRYALPLNAHDTALELRARHSRSEVVEEGAFDGTDIESRSTTYSIGLAHPLLRSPRHRLRIGVRGEKRRSRTFLEDVPFSFSRGPERGESRVSVLRAFVEWIHREQSSVLAARSTLSVGVDLLDPTRHSTHEPGSGIPDGRFAAWLGQVQGIWRFEELGGLQLLLRGDVQLSRDPLLSLERFGIGGLRSVRGYRENRLVRDNGLAASLELRMPIWRDPSGRDRVQLASFVDAGRGWNESGDTSRDTLASAGIGLRLSLGRLWLNAYWAGRLREQPRPGTDPQDHGFHVEAGLEIF